MISGQITNTDFWLLLDMQKRIYCNQKSDKNNIHSNYVQKNHLQYFFLSLNFPVLRRPWYQPSTHISHPASLSGLIWESRANTRADMENVM
jgi:hypothetical protein